MEMLDFKLPTESKNSIDESKFNSFFKINTDLCHQNPTSTGKSIQDPVITISTMGISLKEYYRRCHVKIYDDDDLYKQDKATRIEKNDIGKLIITFRTWRCLHRTEQGSHSADIGQLIHHRLWPQGDHRRGQILLHILK
jgi:hypothetical protein